MSEFVTRIRLGTKANHDAVEGIISLPVISSSREVYGLFLKSMASVWIPLERSVLNGPLSQDERFNLDRRMRSSRILKDLNRLGVNDFSSSQISENDPFILESRKNHEDVGVLYVLEGSTLGGAQILKSLGKIGVDAGNGGAFFSGHGSENGSMWKTFLANASEAVQDEQIEEAVFAANRTFQFIIDHLHPTDWTS